MLTALAFEHWGQDVAVARLASTYLIRSHLADWEAALPAIAGAMLRVRWIKESMALAEQLDARGGTARAAAIFFSFSALHYGDSLTADELAAYRSLLQTMVERRKAEGEPEEAARALVSLANSYRAMADPKPAVRLYREALELDAGYDKREHFWMELAGVLFGSHDYDAAATAYGRAIELEADAVARFLRADALLFAGRFSDSASAFDKAIAETEADAIPFGVVAEYGLKREILRLLESWDLDSRERRAAEAHERVAIPEEL